VSVQPKPQNSPIKPRISFMYRGLA